MNRDVVYIFRTEQNIPYTFNIDTWHYMPVIATSYKDAITKLLSKEWLDVQGSLQCLTTVEHVAIRPLNSEWWRSI